MELLRSLLEKQYITVTKDMAQGRQKYRRPERRKVTTEKKSKQRVYDDYVARNSEMAAETGKREPYHLTYARKMKGKENEQKRDQ